MSSYKRDPVDKFITDTLGPAMVLGALAVGIIAYEGIKAAQRASRRPVPDILSFLGVREEKLGEAPPEGEVSETPSRTQAPDDRSHLAVGAVVCLLLGIVLIVGDIGGAAASTQRGLSGTCCFGVFGFVGALLFTVFYIDRGKEPARRAAKEAREQAERERLRHSVTLGFLENGSAFKPLIVPSESRFEHIHILGATGSGKSTLMANMIIQDIQQGRGLCVIDPAGTLIEEILPFVPKDRVEDVILFDVADREYPFSLNLLERVPEIEEVGQQTDGVVSVFIKLFGTSWGPRLENILTNSILTLLYVPGSTLLDIPKLLLDEDYRTETLSKLADPLLVDWWTKGEYAKLARHREHIMVVESILNKVNPWATYPTIRNIVGQPRSSFNMLDVMRTKRVLLVNLNKGLVGRRTARLLGAVLVTENLLAALARTDVAEQPPFFLYVDEFYDFVTTADDIPGAERDPFQELLAQARKSKVGLVVANQEQMQLSLRLAATLDGNVGTRIRCRKHQEVGKDGVIKQEWWTVLVQQLQNPEAREVQKEQELEEDEWGQWLYPFPVPTEGDGELARAVREYSRETYGRPREEVEHDIVERQRRERGETGDVTYYD